MHCIIIVFIIVFITIYIKLPTLIKLFFCFRNKLTGFFIRYRILVMSKLIVKNRFLIQFVIDFILFWFIFLKNDGIIFKSVLNLIQLLKDRAFVWSEITNLWDMKEWNEWYIILLYLSPYGRFQTVSARLQFFLHVSTFCSVICFILYLLLFNDLPKRYRSWKWLIGVASGIITWYLGFNMCSIILEIPFFSNMIAAFISVIASHVIIFFTILFIWTYLESL